MMYRCGYIVIYGTIIIIGIFRYIIIIIYEVSTKRRGKFADQNRAGSSFCHVIRSCKLS